MTILILNHGQKKRVSVKFKWTDLVGCSVLNASTYYYTVTVYLLSNKNNK